VSEIEIGVLRRIRLVRRVGKEIHEDAAGVINEVTESLRDEDGVHIAGRGLFELEKVVIGRGFSSGISIVAEGRFASGEMCTDMVLLVCITRAISGRGCQRGWRKRDRAVRRA